MKLFLHIGTHKTGTTSIQRFLHAHRKTLAARGVWYPDFSLVGFRSHYAHLDFARALADEGSVRFDLARAEQFAQEVIRRAVDYDVVLISAEPFYRHTLPRTKESEPGYFEARSTYVRRVRSLWGDLTPEVVVCLRRQDRFAQSLYNEHLKVTKYKHDFMRFVRERHVLFEYDRQLEVWEQEFGAPRLFLFEDLVGAKEGLVKRFLTGLGIADSVLCDLAEPPVQNLSLPLELLAFKRELNRSSLSNEQLASLARLLDSEAFVERCGIKTSKMDWVSGEELSTWLALFDEGNEAVLSRWGPSSSRSLFPQPSFDANVFNGLSNRGFYQLVASLFEWMAD